MGHEAFFFRPLGMVKTVLNSLILYPLLASSLFPLEKTVSRYSVSLPLHNIKFTIVSSAASPWHLSAHLRGDSADLDPVPFPAPTTTH